MSGFNNSILGGAATLIRRAIQSPNFVAGVSGWAINKDGTAQFNELTLIVQQTNAAILIYNGQAGLGNLIGSWSNSAGTDQFGNAYPAGLNATQGALSGLSIAASNLATSILSNCTVDGSTIQNSGMSGGTIIETVITFDTTGGSLVVYATTTTTVTQTVNGSYFFTVPAGVTTLDVACQGAGGGGGGGSNTSGGVGGGGGEYAEEQNYTVQPNSIIQYVVGNGGDNSPTGGGPGGDGGDTFFDISNGGVIGHGGGGNGSGGTGSTNTIHHDGGSGGTTGGNNGGTGGGGSGGKTGAGGNSANSTGNSGTAGGAAGAGGGAAGGAGGGNAGNGSNGVAPGGGGGAAGAGSGTVSFDKTYTATGTHSYQGSDAGNGKINDNGRCYQGGNIGDTFNGKAKSWLVFNHSQIASDLAGVSIGSTSLTLNNNHSWFNSGMTVCVGWDTATSFGSTKGDPSGANIDAHEFHVNEGSTITQSIGGLGTAFKNGTAFNVVLFKNSNSLTYYGYFAGSSQSGPPKVRIQGSSGGVQTTSGSGADGKITITYTTGAAPIISISVAGFTDQFGNAIPAGVYLWNGSAPAVQAGALGLFAAAGQLKYTSADGNAYNTGRLTVVSSTNSSFTTSMATLNGLSAPLGVGTYRIHAQLSVNNPGTAGQGALSFRMQGTNGLAVSGGRVTILEFVAPGTVGIADAATLGTTLTSSSTPGTGGAQRIVTIDGYFVVTVAGTINVQGSQAATVACNVQQLGSYLEVEPVA